MSIITSVSIKSLTVPPEDTISVLSIVATVRVTSGAIPPPKSASAIVMTSPTA